MKKNEPVKKENRLEKVIVFLLVVLISLLSFSVGVISGKGLSDKEYALKSFDQKYSHALNEGGEGEDKEASAESDLSEEEIQQLANAAIQAAEKSSATVTEGDEHEGAAHGTAHGKTASAGHEATTAPAKTTKAAPAIKLEDERIPSSVKRAAAETEFTVQVAAYPNPKDAETLSASLVKKGFPAFPIKVSVNGTEWYRVSVGSFKSRKEAVAYEADLKKQGVVKDAVVQKLTK